MNNRIKFIKRTAYGYSDGASSRFRSSADNPSPAPLSSRRPRRTHWRSLSVFQPSFPAIKHIRATRTDTPAGSRTPSEPLAPGTPGNIDSLS
jgi:hypothetical protein